MRSMGTLLLNGTLVIVTLWIISRYLGVFGKKKQNIYSAAVWFLFIIFQAYVQLNSGVASIWTTIISICLVILISVLGYDNGGKRRVLEVLLLHVVWMLVEIIVSFGVSLLPLETDVKNIAGNVISKIVMIIGVYAFSIIWKKTYNELIPLKYYVGLLFVPVGSIYIAMHEFFSIRDVNEVPASLITFCILLLFNITILEIYSKISENFMMEKENAIYAQQIKIMSANTQEQKKMMETFHREKHDWMNKLIVLKREIEDQNTADVLHKIEEIIQNCQSGEMISNSGNKCIDALINVKYATAKEKGIAFDTRIFVPEELSIDQCDIAIVLGNALDNAIEATEHCLSGVKRIEIIMGIKKEAFVLVVRNPFGGSLKKDKRGNLLSTKEEFQKHGYGINSIIRVAEKYNGDVVIEEEDGQFIITVTMNLGEF